MRCKEVQTAHSDAQLSLSTSHNSIQAFNAAKLLMANQVQTSEG